MVASHPPRLADFTSFDLMARLDSALGIRLYGGVRWGKGTVLALLICYLPRGYSP